MFSNLLMLLYKLKIFLRRVTVGFDFIDPRWKFPIFLYHVFVCLLINCILTLVDRQHFVFEKLEF